MPGINIRIGVRKPLTDASSSKIRTGLSEPTQFGEKKPAKFTLGFHMKNGHTGNTAGH